MSVLIGGLYRISHELGQGKNGIVYLGWHDRLNKTIVLKADKRKLNVGPDKLRREVDFLKNLSHKYIPRVYDFFEENGNVYTVMDYIEGESLHDIIQRGVRPTQPDLVRWSCQLLDALNYLHTQPPYGMLHGDIKPANIMLSKDMNICLIDYNISLAMGENGAVRAGLSIGYASPEHYASSSISYLTPNDWTETETLDSEVKTGFQTEGTRYERDGHILLDARSDIYSLGASLYHLISGVKPPRRAEDVKPLSSHVCSPEISAIIKKAMEPNPLFRYQSAREMLDAFMLLPANDKSSRAFRRSIRATGFAAGLLALTGAVSIYCGMSIRNDRQRALTYAEYSASALREGDRDEALKQALKAIPGDGFLEAEVTAEAIRALTDALGVYDLRDGYSFDNRIELPSAPFRINSSPGGKYISADYAYETALYDGATGSRVRSVPLEESAYAQTVFLDDSRIVSSTPDGVKCIDILSGDELWRGGKALSIAVSGDGKVLAATDRRSGRSIIYEAATGSIIRECSFEGKSMFVPENDIFADSNDYIFSLDKKGQHLAVSYADGSVIIYGSSESEDLILYDGSAFSAFSGGFCKGSFLCTASDGAKTELTMIDIETAEVTASYSTGATLTANVTEDGIYVSEAGTVIEIDADSLEEKELLYLEKSAVRLFDIDPASGNIIVCDTEKNISVRDRGDNQLFAHLDEKDIDFLKINGDYALIASRNDSYISVLRSRKHDDADIAQYDAEFQHDEARINSNASGSMLFDYRAFIISDKNGRTLVKVNLPDQTGIYDQQFVRENGTAYLEVIWNDGRVRRYSAASGELLYDNKGTLPDRSLNEEFFTDGYRFVSSLHGAPEVYSIETGERLGTLQDEDYLTYITQYGDYIFAEYVNDEGSRYGVILNERLEKLAVLPGMCDLYDGRIIFDYGAGLLRESPIYSLEDLLRLAAG